ncbi:unnamed protein product, partial [Prorocentrum cordatum]
GRRSPRRPLHQRTPRAAAPRGGRGPLAGPGTFSARRRRPAVLPRAAGARVKKHCGGAGRSKRRTTTTAEGRRQGRERRGGQEQAPPPEKTGSNRRPPRPPRARDHAGGRRCDSSAKPRGRVARGRPPSPGPSELAHGEHAGQASDEEKDEEDREEQATLGSCSDQASAGSGTAAARP